MPGIAPKQNAFKSKIAPHKHKSIVKLFLARRCNSPPLPANGALCLSTPKHNGKSVTDSDYPFGIFKLLLICIDKWSEEGFIVKLRVGPVNNCGSYSLMIY
jgi:hypothetical protein